MNPTLSSRQLRAFLALAHRRSYTRAARDLSISQSALTHSIQALERELGVQLVCFVGRKLQLTSTGKKILPHAKKILAAMRAIRARAETAPAVGRRVQRHQLAA